MWNIITGGNSIKNLSKCFKFNTGILSVYSVRGGTFILGVNSPLYDNFNSIITGKATRHVKSVYLFKFFLYSFIVVWARIIFKGKGFRIRNFQKDLKLTLNFGHSHWDRVKFYRYWFFWKIKRQNYLIVAYSDVYFHLFLSIFPNIKLLNRYTKRGLRLKRQAIIRRFGKISQHISSLH